MALMVSYLNPKMVKMNCPNIILEKLQVLESPDNNTVTVNITYSIPNTGINDQLELNFN